MEYKDIKLTTEAIKLAQFLKHVDAVSSGGQVKHFLEEGLVRVNGVTERRRGRKLIAGDLVEIDGAISFRVRT